MANKNKMKVYLAERAGFCFGVKRAMDIVSELEGEEDVYTFGPLIHNPQVVEKLRQKGIKCAENIKDIVKGKVVIRAHGVSPRTIQELKELKLKIVDATCPYVKKVHKLTKKLDQEGYQVIILGEKEHPEVIGIKGNSENAIVIEKLEDIESLKSYSKIGLVSQTTQSKDKFKLLSDKLTDYADELKVYNTICNATEQRQKTAVKLAKQMDLIIVLGGYNSGNTRRLAELCSKETETVHIEQFSDLDKAILDDKEKVGVTAGASTPDYLIEDLIQKLESYTVG
ncbi:MAG: 4-hydroxy-3-methylbut-2-enyl diphosphate reductase [Nanoarchaeota archaeon]|nr:4-hydroxy-3-methylbut-2-enyl diphosphate reductase [Nanoarchaeota archaeon]